MHLWSEAFSPCAGAELLGCQDTSSAAELNPDELEWTPPLRHSAQLSTGTRKLELELEPGLSYLDNESSSQSSSASNHVSFLALEPLPNKLVSFKCCRNSSRCNTWHGQAKVPPIAFIKQQKLVVRSWLA